MLQRRDTIMLLKVPGLPEEIGYKAEFRICRVCVHWIQPGVAKASAECYNVLYLFFITF